MRMARIRLGSEVQRADHVLQTIQVQGLRLRKIPDQDRQFFGGHALAGDQLKGSNSDSRSTRWLRMRPRTSFR